MTRLPLLLLVAVSLANASADLRIDGTLYSMTSNQYVVASGGKLYTIRKDKLPAPARKTLDANPRGRVTLQVPMTAIEEMRDAPH